MAPSFRSPRESNLTSDTNTHLLGMNQAHPKCTQAARSCLWCACTLVLLLFGCTGGENRVPHKLYEATFQSDPPTTVLVEWRPNSWVVRNGDERIPLQRVGGGEVFSVPVFGGSWTGEWRNDRWLGVWTDSLRPGGYRVPVTLSPIKESLSTEGLSQITQTWRTTEGLLITQTKGDSVWATISTPTGDYRYLAGTNKDKHLTINTFDGSHLFRFDADMRGDSLVDGTFTSGTHYATNFSGVLIHRPKTSWTSAEQPSNGKGLDVVGVTSDGDTVRWTNDRLRTSDKAGLVLDVMGTWCPNCMDEARLLAELAKDHPDIQFVSLAFERSTDESILPRLKQFQHELNLGWDVLLGGKANKRVAADVLGLVDTVHSFPTTLFWKTDGEPVIHTGFNGPATGEGYDKEREFFETQLNRLSGRSKNR